MASDLTIPTADNTPTVKRRKISFFSDFFPVLKKTYKAWNTQDPFRQSAIIAYYAIFSLPALLVIVISLSGFIFGREAVTGQLSSQIGRMMGPETAKQIESMVAEASIDKKSIFASIIAVVVLLFGATGVFVQLQKTLNIIWDVKANPKKQFWSFVKSRLLSFGLILSIGFLLLISLVISSLLTLFGNWMQARMPEITVIMVPVLNYIIAFGLTAILFALMFRFLPDVKVPWKDVWMGAIVTAAFFSLGKFGLSLYFGKAHPGSTYGAAGSIVLIMLWISYSCMILFFGAQFTRQFSIVHGHKVIPSEHAEKEKRDERSEAKGNRK